MAHERWLGLFNSLDTNKDGVITFADTKNGLAQFVQLNKIKEGSPEYKIAADSYEDFWQGFMRDTDLNKDGKVTKEEFEETFKKIGTSGKSSIPKWWWDNIAHLFNSIDTNANGEIDFKEFKEYAKKTSPGASEADVQSAFEWAKNSIHKNVIDQDAYQDLVWIWVSSPDPHPELDIIFAYWK